MGKDICRKPWQGLIAILLVFTIILAYPGQARADTTSISLSSFEATGLLGEVDLIWTTATELNNSGFYVNRSASLYGNRERVAVIIPGVNTPQLFVPSTSDGLSDTIYEVYDRNVTQATTYYYWVESISTSGGSSFSSPQTATTLTNATTTQTPTTTLTFTPTPSATGNSGSTTPTSTATAAATPTLTLTPSLTPYYFPATTQPSPSSTWTPSAGSALTLELTTTATLTNTATLAPLPSITLLFPLVTDTGTPTPTQTDLPHGAFSSLTNPPGDGGLSLGVKLIIALIVLIWALLGAFLYFYIRRIGTGA